MDRIEFEIPGLPHTTNSLGRKHWRVKAAEAKKWRVKVRDLVCAAMGTAWYSRDDNVTFSKAKLTLTRCSSSEPDADGLVSSFKHCIDGIVDSGLIPSDKMSVIGMPTYLWKKAPPKQGKIRVVIERIE